MADNDQEAIKALRVDWSGGDLSWGALWGMLDPEMFYGRVSAALAQALGVYGPAQGVPVGLPQVAGRFAQSSGQDNYNLYYLDWNFAGSWCLGGSWLDRGFNREEGWGLSL